MAQTPFQTESELAAVQQRIGEAYRAWVEDVEGAVEWAAHQPVDDAPSERPTFAELVSASPEQLGDLTARVEAARVDRR